MAMPADLPKFFTDLANPAVKTAICVFHQRFSTNTMPRWPLAQPFRMLAHNGEINTIQGNRSWAKARTQKFMTELLPDIGALGSIVNKSGSDSSSLDNMLELLVVGGMDLHRAVRMLVPPAWQNSPEMDDDLRAFYEYNSMHIEPWDGPAGLVITDGRYAVCTLDRNGLRPSRWVITKDEIITVASEIGTYDYSPEDVVAKGRLGPGQILSIDTQTGTLANTQDIDEQLKSSKPYLKWLKENSTEIHAQEKTIDGITGEALNTHMKLFQVSMEERVQCLRPLIESGIEAVGSMGDDTPMAVLSQKQRSLFDYFRQQFAQVTNPPIDPLREAIVMSLETCLGKELCVYTETPEHAERLILQTPILSPAVYGEMTTISDPKYAHDQLKLAYDANKTDLKSAVIALCDAAVASVKSGKVFIVLSDENISPAETPIHVALAVGAIHHRLIDDGLRTDSNIIAATATVRDSHQAAVLIGYGATAVYPYLAFSLINDLINDNEVIMEPVDAYQKFIKGIDKGLMKIRRDL